MPFAPFMLGNSALTIDGDAYAGEISAATFTPSSSIVSWTAINGNTASFTAPSTWVLDLTFAQDWAEADSLSRYLHSAEGTSVVCVFTPKAGGPTVTATISIAPGAIGGNTTAVAESTVQLGSTKPVLSAGA